MTVFITGYVRSEIKSEKGIDDRRISQGSLDFVDSLFVMGTSEEKARILQDAYSQYMEIMKSGLKISVRDVGWTTRC